jgi:trans-aconitate methyltransferase
MEFGCGTGTNTKIMKDFWPSCKIIGLDNSKASLNVARQRVAQEEAYFITPEEFRNGENQAVDWVFCNGVFHHIDVETRNDVFRSILEHLRPGGMFTLFDNNPFNPGARWVMHRIPFDRDAQMLNPYRVKLRLAELGFEDITCHFLFIFPKFLSFLRLLEPSMSGLPLGAQFGLFARRSLTL